MPRGLILLGLVGCTGNDPVALDGTTSVPADSTAPIIDTAPDWPLWLYTATAEQGSVELHTLDGQHAATIDGALVGGQLLGPTLMADLDHEIHFQLTNQLPTELTIDCDGVEQIDTPTVAAGATDTTVVRSTSGPGVHRWAGGDGSPQGLLVIRDEVASAADSVLQQVNVVVVGSSSAQVDDCVVGTETLGCPVWVTPDDFEAVVVQRLVQTYTPEGARHGGGANEFIVTTPAEPRLELEEGRTTAVHLANLSNRAHTLSLAGLGGTVDGLPVSEVALKPGATSYVWIDSFLAGSHSIVCEDCAHLGLHEAALSSQR